ncbi:unnamed protein product [Pleuronectes platessa]|uniref:Uncharacterized protein n=1 Tax=Pleuronectes platessa TaxID=8262 RepID=A0A9N7YYM8_PLEPL|nr:unnamed protein product [Pleuronectes platessa]
MGGVRGFQRGGTFSGVSPVSPLSNLGEPSRPCSSSLSSVVPSCRLQRSSVFIGPPTVATQIMEEEERGGEKMNGWRDGELLVPHADMEAFSRLAFALLLFACLRVYMVMTPTDREEKIMEDGK